MTTRRNDSSSSSTWRYASGRTSCENTWLLNIRSNINSMWGREYWVRSRYWLTYILMSTQIRTWPLGFSTGMIGVVLNFLVSTLLIMPKASNRLSSASNLVWRACGSILNSMKLKFGLICRWALNALIRGRVTVSKRSLYFVRSDVSKIITSSSWVWCIDKTLNYAIYSRPSRKAVSGLSRKTTHSWLNLPLSLNSTLAIPSTGITFLKRHLWELNLGKV